MGIILAILAGFGLLAVASQKPGSSNLGDDPDPEVPPVPRAMLPPQPGGNGKNGKSQVIIPEIISNGSAPTLRPEQARLLALLVLFARDKKYPAGRKRYLDANLALYTVKLARALNLPRTANAVRSDGIIPDDEYLPGRTKNIRDLVLSYGSTGKA